MGLDETSSTGDIGSVQHIIGENVCYGTRMFCEIYCYWCVLWEITMQNTVVEKITHVCRFRKVLQWIESIFISFESNSVQFIYTYWECF